jgi:alpha-glucoside transport system substrate-binding protein
MVAPWEADTGGEVDFVGTRDTAVQLTLNVEGNNPPDIAIPAEIGLLQQFARDGLLTPLSECAGPAGEGTLEEYVRANYPQAFIDLGTVDGTLYGFFMKADGKGFIWYNPGFFTANSLQPLAADATYDDLITLSEAILATGTPPWTIGVESAAASGWPGTDWVQTILINNVEGGAEAAAGQRDVIGAGR